MKTKGVFFENEGGPPIPSNRNEEGNPHTLVYLEAITCFTSSICYHKEMKAVIVSQNETKVHDFSKTFLIVVIFYVTIRMIWLNGDNWS